MTQSPVHLLHRIAQGNQPWKAYPATKFEQRFDDPDKSFRVLYACSVRLGCFIECLAHFRKATLPDFVDLEEKFGPSFPQGIVPADWRQNRFSQSATVGGMFADIAHSGWIAHFQREMPSRLLRELNDPWIDLSGIYQAKRRAVTQWMARRVFEDEGRFAGIYYTSRHGAEFANWAIFEGRGEVAPESLPALISENDQDLLAACAQLQISPPTGHLTDTKLSD